MASNKTMCDIFLGNTIQLAFHWIRMGVITVTSYQRHDVSNHHQLDTLFSCLFRLKTKRNIKVCGGFPAKGPVMRKPFPCHGLIMVCKCVDTGGWMASCFHNFMAFSYRERVNESFVLQNVVITLQHTVRKSIIPKQNTHVLFWI